jgi:hypothetical protein
MCSIGLRLATVATMVRVSARVTRYRAYGHRGVGTVGQQPMPVTPQTTPRPARAAAPRVRGGSNGLRASSDDGWAWPNQRRGRPNAAGQPSYHRRGSRVPRSCLARAVDAGVCHRTRPTRRRQALCLARSPPYDVRSRSDDLAGAHSPPPPAAAQRQHGEGSREPHELAGAAAPDEKWPIIDPDSTF